MCAEFAPNGTGQVQGTQKNTNTTKNYVQLLSAKQITP